MEQAILRSDWDEMERYASALEAYTRDEPLPYTDFYFERARALAACANDGASPACRERLQVLRDEGRRCKLVTATAAIEAALGET
jgi:hypothetical protein